MSEWKKLDISNLESDILTGEYEFEVWVGNSLEKYIRWCESPYKALARALYNGQKIRYRNLEPLFPTHEEIMTKWWKTEDRGWQRVTKYFNSGISPYYLDANESRSARRLDKQWFTNRESADMPPEQS